ncbi:MAG: hypothetical protein AAFV27_03570 [Pseudomonadota bacterium]
MKRPGAIHPNRPSAGSRRVPRSRTEAAVELVRTEFERARLSRDLQQLAHRTSHAVSALATHRTRADHLLARLNDRTEGE